MKNKPIKVIITGSSGMVGEGVLMECLNDSRIGSILTLNRRSSGIVHPKLQELILPDLHDLSSVEHQLIGYSACFYCLGTTSAGKTEDEYVDVIYTLTIKIASLLCRLNSDMVFCYMSAAGADNKEKGRIMWARVKGKTENDLKKMPFGGFYAFRPMLLTPTKGSARTHSFYNYITWLFPLGRRLFPNSFCTLKEMSLAMINVGIHGYSNGIIEPRDMVDLAKQTN